MHAYKVSERETYQEDVLDTLMLLVAAQARFCSY